MNKILVVVAFLFISQATLSQDFMEIGSYEFKTAKSYQEQEDNIVLCANYLFDTPADENGLNRLLATQFILKWMEGTPDYTFDLTSEMADFTKGNDDLFGMLLAGMSKVVLENKGTTLTTDEIFSQTKDLLVAYCANPDNKMKPSKKIKKILKSRKG